MTKHSPAAVSDRYTACGIVPVPGDSIVLTDAETDCIACQDAILRRERSGRRKLAMPRYRGGIIRHVKST